MTQIRQVAVSRPPEASPHQAIRKLVHAVAANPVGRWLVMFARRLAQSTTLSAAANKLLSTFSAPDHLTFQARPARPARAPEKSLTVITANLWHDWPRHRRHLSRLEAFARLVEQEGADILLLQEVARIGDFRADEWLATRLGMAHAYGQANGDNHHGPFEEGVAVLSRFPLAEPSLCYLAPRPLSLVRRLAIGVTVQTPGGDLFAVSAHLGHGRKLNTRQSNRLQEWVEALAYDRPAVVGGDFNTGENAPQMRRLRERWLDVFRQANPDDDGITYHLHWPWGYPLLRQRLDYIFLQHGRSPWRVQEAWATQSPGQPHSDHLAVVARLDRGTSSPGGDLLDYVNGTSVPVAAIPRSMLK